VLVEILEHLVQKDTPFEYIDTHSGAGLYDLNSPHATKLQEHTNGISKLNTEDFPELARYFEVINKYNDPGSIHIYPGSPLIAKYFLRPQDRAWLFELHPQDYASLKNNMGSNKKIRVSSEDGFKSLMALLPPKSRRALVLIDPSYEIKSDYDLVVETVIKACKKFSTGIYAIWYPVVERHKIETLEHKFISSGIKNIQRFELGIAADSNERGMTSAGMFVINPPWKLSDKMSVVLPKLSKILSQGDGHFYKCDTITDE
jgi:23S rRNA (adenine2030-N6)-methyltransferase